MATTRDCVDYLNDQIGIAPANSQEELQAAQLIQQIMDEHQLETRLQEFDAPGSGDLPYRILMVVLFVGVLLAGIQGTPAAIVGIVLVVICMLLFLLRFMGNDLLSNLGPRARSQNVVGVHRAEGPLVTKGSRPIVIVAHYDTPRENFLYKAPMARFQPLLRRYAPICVAIACVLGLLQGVGFLPAIARRLFWVVALVASLPLVILGAASIVERFSGYTDGANDNKAAVAAMLGVLGKVRPGDDSATGYEAAHPIRQVQPVEEEAEEEVPEEEPEPEPEPIPQLVTDRYETVVGVRHGKETLAALRMLPNSCEIVYAEPRLVSRVIRPEGVDEGDYADLEGMPADQLGPLARLRHAARADYDRAEAEEGPSLSERGHELASKVGGFFSGLRDRLPKRKAAEDEEAVIPMGEPAEYEDELPAQGVAVATEDMPCDEPYAFADDEVEEAAEAGDVEEPAFLDAVEVADETDDAYGATLGVEDVQGDADAYDEAYGDVEAYDDVDGYGDFVDDAVFGEAEGVASIEDAYFDDEPEESFQTKFANMISRATHFFTDRFHGKDTAEDELYEAEDEPAEAAYEDEALAEDAPAEVADEAVEEAAASLGETQLWTVAPEDLVDEEVEEPSAGDTADFDAQPSVAEGYELWDRDEYESVVESVAEVADEPESEETEAMVEPEIEAQPYAEVEPEPYAWYVPEPEAEEPEAEEEPAVEEEPEIDEEPEYIEPEEDLEPVETVEIEGEELDDLEDEELEDEDEEPEDDSEPEDDEFEPEAEDGEPEDEVAYVDESEDVGYEEEDESEDDEPEVADADYEAEDELGYEDTTEDVGYEEEDEFEDDEPEPEDDEPELEDDEPEPEDDELDVVEDTAQFEPFAAVEPIAYEDEQPEPEPEAAFEPEPEVAAEPEPVVAAEPEPEPAYEAEADTAAFAIPEWLVNPRATVTLESRSNPEPEPAAEAELELEPEPELEPAPATYDASVLVEGITFTDEPEPTDSEIDLMDGSGLDAIVNDDISALDVRAPEPTPEPAPVDDPAWGVSEFRPSASNIARRASLLDLPDPALDATSDPLESSGVRTAEAIRRRLANLTNLDDPDDGPSGSSSRSGHWKGGATTRAGLRIVDDETLADVESLEEFASLDQMSEEEQEQLRDAILDMSDDELLAHDIWFVALGASSLNHAGMTAFLQDFRTQIRGAFMVNLDCIGAGNLTLMTREGISSARRADRRMERLFTQIAADLHIDIEKAPLDWAETDVTQAMRRSVRGLTIMGLSDDGVPALSHTAEDMSLAVDKTQASNVSAMIAELIRRA